jgi:hypothetical protein
MSRRMHTISMKLGLLFATSMLAACSASSEEAGVCEPNADAISHAQGWGSNGRMMNGTRTNGVAIQGIALNGIAVKGVSLAGVALPEGSELVGAAADGREVRGDAFVGAVLTGVDAEGTAVPLTITSYARTPDGALATYGLARDGVNVCPGNERGIFVMGIWDETGARHGYMSLGAHTIETTFSCTSGVVAKCMIWGYEPLKVGIQLHQTCTRMARADYCGNGTSFTKDGTPIDLFDLNEINRPSSERDFLFEAGWAPDGAVCVSRPRYDTRLPSGERALPSCWSTLPNCDDWTTAQSAGAIMGNASRLTTKTVCR